MGVADSDDDWKAGAFYGSGNFYTLVLEKLKPVLTNKYGCSQEGVIPYSIRSFFEREAITPLFDKAGDAGSGSGITVSMLNCRIEPPLC